MPLPRSITERLRLPVIGAPMFIVSNPELVIAQCKAGVVGSFPALNARPAAQLEVWLERITRELAQWDAEHPERPAAPFAVNQIVHKSNPRLKDDLALCVKYKVPILITSLGAQEIVYDAAHAYGGIVLHDVINQRFAHKAIDKGADGLIAVATGAGGHAGTQSPFAFMQELRDWFDGPIALSGSIANGRSILAARTLGADLAYVGTPFIATTEANAAPAYKQMLIESQADDILYTDHFTGVGGNYLKASIASLGLNPERLPHTESKGMDFSAEDGQHGDPNKPKAWKDIWSAGQGVGQVTRILATQNLVDQLAGEYFAALESLTHPSAG